MHSLRLVVDDDVLLVRDAVHLLLVNVARGPIGSEVEQVTKQIPRKLGPFYSRGEVRVVGLAVVEVILKPRAVNAVLQLYLGLSFTTQ